MAKSSSEQFLCIGDEITLHDEDGNVLVTEDPLETRAYARLVSDNEQTLSSEALGARLFQVEPQQSYSERRALEHFLGDEEERENLYYEGSPDELVELSVLESRAAKERIQNDAEKRRLFGKPVIYGQVIQLYNAHFKKYLTVTGRTCESDASHVQVDLSKDTVGYFKIIPRYRIRVDGEPVRLGDTVAIQCLRPEGFLNVGSHRLHSDVFNLDYYEIYTHTRISSWTLQAHRTAASRQIGSPEKFINTGQYLRFYHKEMEAYLEAPMSKRDKSGVRLRKHVINPLDPKESDSPLAFWEIENVTTASGSKIRWKRPVRIRHAASRAYLYIDPNNVSIDMKTHKVSFSFGLVSNPQIFSNNDATLFTLLPASDTKDSHVSFGTYVRVQHVLTKCWMHSDTDESSFNRTSASPIPTMQLTQTPESLHDHHASRKSIASIASSISDRYLSTDPNVYRSRTFATPTYPITASQDFHYHDCFSITLVGNKLHDTFNYINEMIPQLHAFLSKERPGTEQSRFPIADKEYSSLKKILEALIQFCTESKQADVSARAGIANEYHQALLRDIGAIEAAINIIQIPFNLSKRYELRPSLSAKRDSTQEEAVSIIDLHNGRENRLRSILLLCYNLLRVFLIQGEDLEEFAKNQQHVLQIAGDTGIELFIRHLTCGVGATDMMSRLLYNNTQVVDAIAAIRPQFVSILVNLTIEKLRTMVKRLIRCEDGYPPPLELRQDCEAASGVALLGSLCPTTEQHASTTNHGDYIASRLFSVDNCLLQTRIIKETSAVQVLLLGDDEWRDLEELLQKCQPSIALLLQNSLHLIYLLSMEANAKRLRTARTCVPEDVCLRCLSNVQLPDNIRAAFCDMLRVLYVNVPPYSNVLLTDFTLQYDHLVNTNDYPSGGSGDLENKTPAFFEHLKRWTMVFMDEKRHQFSTAKEEIVLLTAVLKLVHAELRLGFFTDSNDMKRLFRSMIHVLDGRTDARNPEHLKVIQHDMARPWKERYVLTEETQPMMDVKICILEIFDLIFDLRLHVRINKLASKWKDMENNVDTEAQHSPRGMLVAIFEETMLRHRENILMPILKDILKYQYAPLKRIAVIIMHRIYNDCEDLFKKAKKVLLLGEPQQVFVYHGVKKRLARIGNLLSIDRLNLSQLPALEHILRELLDLFQGKTIDMDDRIVNLERPQNQRVVYSKIFKNLSAHSLIARLLLALKRQLLGSASVNGSLSSENFHTVDYFDAEAACVGNMKLGLDLLYELVKDDREFQGHFVISHMDVLIDIGECHPMLASALIPICGNNLHISLRVTEAHIQRILDLAREYQGEYLQLLRVFVKAQGKVLKKHQDCIVCYIMDKREIYVPFETPEDLLAFGQADYCAALLELLSVCGQNDNTFAQSFARTLFSIHDLVTVINSNEAQLKVKAGAFQFLSSIYLDNVEVPSSIPISEDTHILSLMESCCLAMSEFEANSTTPEMIHCIYHGVLVFLRSMFEHHLSAEIIVDDKLQRLCPKLVDLTVGLLQSNGGCDRKALKNVLACLDSMINVAGFGSSIEPDILREKLRRAVVQVNDKRDKLAKLLDSINAKFQGFIRALMAHNDVKMLMQNEFKQLGSHFSLAQSSSKDDVKSLIDYLSMMTNVKEVDPREAYQVATIRLLEEIPLQYIRERSKQNHLDDPVRYELLEKKKMHAQNTLNRLGCTLVAQNLLSSPRKNIFEAAVKLLIALLEGGNKNVQDRLEEYFYSIREERFFYSFHHRLQTSIGSLKEAQVHLVRAAQKMNRQQFTATNETKRNGAQPNQRGHHHRRQPSSLDPSRRRMTMYDSQVSANQFGQQSAVVYQKFASLMAEETAEFGTTSEEFDSMRDTMRALQLMVEGHNINLQRYLAKQPDNIKSFNIVQDVVEYLHAIAPICNIQNVRLIIQVLDTITDLAQGCPENQLTIFTHKIVHPANIILRESYNNCPSSLIDELKSKVMICLLSLLEGGMDNSEMIFREMADSLDLSVVIRNMSLTFDSNVEHLNSSGVYEKLDCGFQYCMLLMTLWPALPECQRAILEGNKAFEFFQRNTGKIEVVMDYNQEKQLSRVLFPIPEICKYLREDTKQRFLWNVKRDSPSAKIEDFVQLSNNIIYEIESHAKVASNKYLSILSNHSKLWWKAAYVTTVLLNMLMLGCSSTFLTSSDPMNRAFCYRFEGFLHSILGLLHITFWGLSTAEFSFVQLPIIVNRNNPSKQRMFGHDAFRSDITTMEIFSQTVKIDLSSIVGRLLERSFLYHVIMFCLSFVGFYNPSFYSLHLLDFAFRDRILQGVIASITLNVNSISRTALFGIIVVYIHSVVAYVFFREEFDISKGLHCSTLSQCFVTILSHGVRAGGGIGDILEPDVNEEPRGWRTAFEMSFFLLVVVFLLNAIFGIIFDTFGHLRDERSAVQQDIKNSCFICSIPAIEFQRQEKNGFDKHVRNDHNIWQYLFFLVHLKTKDRTEYTGPESYVADCLKDANYNFFPVNRALCLKQKEDNDTERLEKLEETAHKLLEKVNNLEEHLEKLSESQSRSRSNSLMLSPM